MAAQSLCNCVNIVVFDTKIFTGLLHNRRNLHVMGLNNARKEVVCGLVVEGSCKDSPEPTICSVVLCCGYLELSP